jgi:hypothetical protein
LKAACVAAKSIAQIPLTSHSGGVKGKSTSKPYSDTADIRNAAQADNVRSLVFMTALFSPLLPPSEANGALALRAVWMTAESRRLRVPFASEGMGVGSG